MNNEQNEIMEEEIDELDYTPDEDLLALQGKDLTVEVVGYVGDIVERRSVKNAKYEIYKFIFTNGNLRMKVMIWNSPTGALIDKYERHIMSRRKIHLELAHGGEPDRRFWNAADGLIFYELTIQKTTLVKLGNFHGSINAAVLPREAQNVDFHTIPIEGPIVIEGYLKSEFANSPGRYGVSSYGIGAIGDGVNRKINIQITNFVNCNLTKGTPVRVRGDITNINGSYFILCPTIQSIEEIQGRERISLRQLIRCNRQVIPVDPNNAVAVAPQNIGNNNQIGIAQPALLAPNPAMVAVQPPILQNNNQNGLQQAAIFVAPQDRQIAQHHAIIAVQPPILQNNNQNGVQQAAVVVAPQDRQNDQNENDLPEAPQENQNERVEPVEVDDILPEGDPSNQVRAGPSRNDRIACSNDNESGKQSSKKRAADFKAKVSKKPKGETSDESSDSEAFSESSDSD